MNFLDRSTYKHWILFAVTFCLVVMLDRGPAMAFQPQPEPPGVFMPTLTPDDALRINVAFVTDNEVLKRTRCLILIRSLLSGEVLREEEFVLERGKGMSMDFSYDDLTRTMVDSSELVGDRFDLPLRVQIKSAKKKYVFVAFEIHNVEITQTRTYIPCGAEPFK